MYDVVIVGSGPAGTFSAYSLQGLNTLVLDVGHRPPRLRDLDGNFYDLRRQRKDLFEQLIGYAFEGLHNVYKQNISLKLKAPYMSYIVQDWATLSPIKSQTFAGVMSFALGGLANAWGAGVFRFNQRDLQGFPLTAAELEPFYDELTEHIGISGSNDDLVPYFGEEPRLMPPIRNAHSTTEILDGFRRYKEYFKKNGIVIGRSRLAVLTRSHNGRAPYLYDNLEFYKPYNPAIYNPVFTLDALSAKGLVTVESGYLVTRYRHREGFVEVEARRLADGVLRTFRAKALILAAGTLSTTKIVLASNADTESRRPILDNPMVCIPFVRLNRIGASMETSGGSIGQLNLVYDDPGSGDLLQAGIYGTTGPLRSDILFQLPLNVSANLILSKYIAPAMTLLMLFYPGRRDPNNYLRLTPEGELEIEYVWASPRSPEHRIIEVFRKIGYLSAKRAVQYPPMGSSLHYAGTLPMRSNPGRYETHPDGRLAGTDSVYIADGACLSELPAKNLTFTIMANAMRIATKLKNKLT